MTGYDVVVVGGRVAGASTALLLARAGVRVALVERSSYGSDTVSTHALMRAGVMQLARWGVLDTVVSTGLPPVRHTLFHYADGETVGVAIRPYAGVDALYAPRRRTLDRVLVDAAADAGADVRHDTAVSEVLRGTDGRVRGVRLVGPAGVRHDLRAAITVGADGLRSTVAAQVRAHVLRRGRHAGAVLYRYFTELPAAGYEWAYGEGATAGLIPTEDGETLAFVATTPGRMREERRAGTDGAFVRLMAAAAPGLADRVRGASPAGRIHGWAGATGHVRQSWGRGWALVGDAAYFKDPATAHGMTDALRDADLLATAVLQTLGDGAREPTRDGGLPGHPRPVVPAAVRGDRRGRLLRLGPRPGAGAAACRERRDERRGRPPQPPVRPRAPRFLHEDPP
ncbi:MAG: NAD(P)/FAD-dependent oxidoreductase [Nocardioides sp.]